MNYDVFGGLQEWDRVLDRVQQIRNDGTLDAHQPGLARLARYPFNWQIRHAGLRGIAELRTPGDEVIRVAVQIMTDEKCDLETRVLAGTAVSACLSNGNGTISESARSEAAASICDLLNQPQPPVLHNIVRGCRQCLNSAARATTAT